MQIFLKKQKISLLFRAATLPVTIQNYHRILHSEIYLVLIFFYYWFSVYSFPFLLLLTCQCWLPDQTILEGSSTVVIQIFSYNHNFAEQHNSFSSPTVEFMPFSFQLKNLNSGTSVIFNIQCRSPSYDDRSYSAHARSLTGRVTGALHRPRAVSIIRIWCITPCTCRLSAQISY